MEPAVQEQKNQNLAGTAGKPGDYQPLFENLRHVIDVSRKKFDLKRASNSDKQKWARLLITGCEAYGSLMEKAKIELIELRISQIEMRVVNTANE